MYENFSQGFLAAYARNSDDENNIRAGAGKKFFTTALDLLCEAGYTKFSLTCKDHLVKEPLIICTVCVTGSPRLRLQRIDIRLRPRRGLPV
ncbi:MAG: hypothetical protein Q4E17_07010 [Synergistes sp.]|nr:hypothetical protein [Synergistes sp.]